MLHNTKMHLNDLKMFKKLSDCNLLLSDNFLMFIYIIIFVTLTDGTVKISKVQMTIVE